MAKHSGQFAKMIMGGVMESTALAEIQIWHD